MDNDTPAVPQGQAAPSPDVQSEPTTPSEATVEVPTEAPKPSDETNFESLAAKKGFKSPDDLAKAYANLESQNTKKSMENAELHKLFFQPETKEDIKPPEAPLSKDEEKALTELRQFVHKEAVEPLEQKFEQRLQKELAKMELNMVLKDNPDFAKYANEVKDLKAKYPNMPFGEAYTYAKAMKGDLVSEAKAKAFSEGARVGYKQVAAQVAPTKPVSEDKIPAGDLLQGAGSRWRTTARTSPEQRARIQAEQKLVEQEIFGQELRGF